MSAVGPRLKDLGRWSSGGTPPRDRQELWEGELPWISAKDFHNGELRVPTAFITEEAGERYSRIAPAGSILLIVRGMALAHGLQVAETRGRVAFNQDLRALTVARHLVPRFVYYALRGNRFRLDAHIDRAAHGTARVIDSLIAERVHVPDPVEQQRVADFLDREGARIRGLADVIERASGRAAADHWEAAYGRLVEREGGKCSRLVDLTGPVVAGAWGDDVGVAGSEAVCYRVADFDRLTIRTRQGRTERSISPDALRRLALAPGDLLIEKSGGGANSPVGFVVRYAQDDHQAICSNFTGRIRPEGRADPLYLAHVFGALYGMRRNEPYVKQVTGIQNLDVHGYLRLRVPYRELATQRLLGAREEQRLTAVNQTRQQFDQLKALLAEYRDALITEAVTGKLDITRISDQRLDESAHAAMEGEAPEVLSA